ncbi:MAG: OmpA family protein [Alphaproteobacteria bacterium]|nr:OmpA family protein [Alphaproteobacteria bacterium]
MSAGLVTLLALLPSAAFAQAAPNSGFDAHGFRLAAHDADARDPLVVARPGAFVAQSWFASGVFEYASQPLVFERPEGTVVELDDLVAANLSVGYAPHERVRLDLAAPLFFYGEGVDGPLGAGLGDVRASALVSLVAPLPEDGGLGLGFVVNADIPTGRPEAWLGQYTIAGGVGVAATWEGEKLTVGASASTQMRPNTDPDDRPAYTRGGDAFGWGGSVGYLVADTTGLTLEAHGEVPVDPTVRTAIGVPAEAILSFRHVRSNGGFLTAGLGTALTRGAGASPLRLLVGGGFGDVDGPWRDADGDGIEDKVDACPEVPETLNGFEDEDGCRDTLPKLVVRAMGPDGAGLDDAAIEATGPIVVDGVGEVVAEGPAVLPGTEWSIAAKRGNCLAGTASVTLDRRDMAVDVPLSLVRDGKLMVEVIGAEGQPIEGANIEIRTDEAACGPDAPVDLAGGTGEIPLGVGTFRVVVRAPDHTLHSESFALEAGGQHVIRATLKPTKVRVEKEAIVILEKVYFDTGKATIQERSFELLDEVASVILANEIAKVEVQGHTDDQGPDASNLKLSQDRADAVRTYLLGKGVQEGVLEAKGYGETTPVADNKTKDGRSQNRRVEFKILQQSAEVEQAPEVEEAPEAPEAPEEGGLKRPEPEPERPAEEGGLKRPEPESPAEEDGLKRPEPEPPADDGGLKRPD